MSVGTTSKFTLAGIPAQTGKAACLLINRFKSREVFDQNPRVLIPSRIKFHQICESNLPRKLTFIQFTNLNSDLNPGTFKFRNF